jgi:cytochrome c553
MMTRRMLNRFVTLSGICASLAMGPNGFGEYVHQESAPAQTGGTGSKTEARLTIRSIIDLLEANHPKNKTDFVKLLPPECRDYHNKVYSSRATACASFEDPRTFLSCTMGFSKIVIAFDGKKPKTPNQTEPPKPGECQNVEIFDLNSPQNEIHSAEIHFNEKPEGLPYEYELEPNRCAHCHGRPTKLLSDMYPDWRGHYESSVQAMKLGSLEHRGYLAHEKAHRNLPPSEKANDFYSQLRWPELKKGLNDEHYGLRFPEKDGDGIYWTNFQSHYFNDMSRAHNDSIARFVMTRPDFRAFSYAWAGVALKCRPEPFFPAQFTSVGQSTSEITADITAKDIRAKRRIMDQVAHFNSDYSSATYSQEDTVAEALTPYFYVAERSGIDPHYFSSTLARDEISFPSFFQEFNQYFLSPTPLGGPAVNEVQKQARLEVDTLKAKNGRFFDTANPLLRLIQTLPEGRNYLASVIKQKAKPALDALEDSVLCAELARRSREALEHAVPGIGYYNMPAVTDPASASNPFAKCVSCHTEELHRKLLAPRIPFESPEEMKAALAADPNLENRIRERLRTKSDKRMPPNEPVTPEELQLIFKFLRGTP